MSLHLDTEKRLRTFNLAPYRTADNSHAPITIDLDHFSIDTDEGRRLAQALTAAACKDGGFWYHSLLLENEKNPERASAQARLAKKMFEYAALPEELVRTDDGAQWNYQAGRTAPGTEKAIGVEEELRDFPFKDGERPLYLGQPNGSGRWMEPVDFRNFAGTSMFPDLRGKPVIPAYFAKQGKSAEWRADMLAIGKPLYQIGDIVSTMVGIGLGIGEEIIKKQMTYRQDLLGPTFCDITKSNENDNISAGHFDCDFGTSLTYSVVGSPQAPGFFLPAGGLNVWTRQGERQEFERPKGDGFAFFQFGKGGRQMSAGLIYPELHEAVVTKRLLAVREQFKKEAREKGLDVQQIFRVNFAYFTTPDVDAPCAITKDHPLWYEGIPQMYIKNALWGDHFREEFSGTGLRKEV